MTSELCFREISAQKSVGGTDFQQGVMDFNFSTGAPQAGYLVVPTFALK